MTGQGSGGHSRLSRAHCQRPPTGVVTWVRGPPARTVWSHSMTGQGSGGHSRLSRAHCQRPPTGVVTWVHGPPAPQLLVTFDDRPVPRRPLAPIPCPLPMPLDQRGHLGARASSPQLLVTFDDRAVLRRALANIPCPLPMPPDQRGHLGARSYSPHHARCRNPSLRTSANISLPSPFPRKRR